MDSYHRQRKKFYWVQEIVIFYLVDRIQKEENDVSQKNSQDFILKHYLQKYKAVEPVIYLLFKEKEEKKNERPFLYLIC